jgi:hypothetical protein
VAHPQIAAFARLANGQAAPLRTIEGQTTKLSRTMHGIAYDSVTDRIIVPAQFSQAILSFRGGASGEELPVRVIQGPRTGIRQADRLAVDPTRGEIFVSDGQVLVFPVEANGDVAPIRTLRGEDGPVAVDPITRTLIVSRRNSIAIYDITANGNDPPLRVIEGPDNSGGMFAAAYNGLVFARTSRNAIGVWSVNDSGAVPPRFKIGEGVAIEIRGVAIDPEGQNVISSDKHLNALISWHVPEVFASAKGAQTEARRAPAN